MCLRIESASLSFCPDLAIIDQVKIFFRSLALTSSYFILFISSALARTGAVFHPSGKSATIVIYSHVSSWGDEPLCSGPDALKIFDSLVIRPELGTDSVVRSFNNDQISVTCENVRQFNFFTCSLRLLASEQITIDPSNESISATFNDDQALELSKLWNTSCGGESFVSEDAKFTMSWQPQKVSWTYNQSKNF